MNLVAGDWHSLLRALGRDAENVVGIGVFWIPDEGVSGNSTGIDNFIGKGIEKKTGAAWHGRTSWADRKRGLLEGRDKEGIIICILQLCP